ncbi:MAG: matrixin family metalloprotease, partial [Thiogranum sp.]|nr:matrixin family metalloprotease [Thiogranum sp.]
MRDWLKRLVSPSRAIDPGKKAAAELAERDSEFRLESLEPRLLLSADPISAELARLVEDSGANESEALAAIVQEIDFQSESEAAFESAGGQNGLLVVWPEGSNAANAEGSDAAETGAENTRIDLLSVVANLVGEALEIIESARSAAGSPDLPIGVTAASQSLQNFNASSADGSVSGADVETTVASSAAAEVAQNSEIIVTDKLLGAVLDNVFERWSASPLASELAGWLAGVTIEMADLDGDLIAELRGQTLYIDLTAAGQGWSVDPGALADLLQATAVEAADGGQTAVSDSGAAADSAAVPVLPVGDMPGSERAELKRPAAGDSSILTAPVDASIGAAGTTPANDAGRTQDSGVDTGAARSGASDLLSMSSVAEQGFDTQTAGPTGNGEGAEQAPGELLLQVLGLVTEALGPGDFVDEGSAAGDLVVGLVAASHRLQENNRSTRSDASRANGKLSKSGTGDAAQVAQAGEADVLVPADSADEMGARAPPVVQPVTDNTEDQDTSTAPEPAAVFSAFEDESIYSGSSDDDSHRLATNDEAMPLAPVADADMPRAPPGDDALARAPPADADTADYLLLDGDAITGSGNSSALTAEQLDTLFQQALRLWSEFSLTAEQLSLLDALTVQISDLSGSILGEAQDDTLYIDSDAAGHGWFIDATPDEHSEFLSSFGDQVLIAAAGSEAEGRVDLLTVLMHEIGHALGFGHESQLAVMTDLLAAGERFLLSAISESTGELHLVSDAPLVIAEGSTFTNSGDLSGTGEIIGDVVNEGVLRPGNSPGIITITGNLTLDGSDPDAVDDSYTPIGTDTVGSIEIEIAGDGGVAGTDFDQIQVSGDVVLGGTLNVDVLGGFAPAEGDTFDILTFTGSVSGAFEHATGLYGFGDGTLFFEVVVQTDRVQLVVKAAPGGNYILSRTPIINDVLGLYYSDYFTFDASVTLGGELAISDYVSLAGTFEFGVNLLQDVTIGTGLSTNLVGTATETLIRSQLATLTLLYPGLSLSSDLQTLSGVPVTTLEIGGSNIQAFAGTNGPYWTDLDADGSVSWSFDTGDGDDASRTITAGSVTIDSVLYSVGGLAILPANTLVTLLASDGVLNFGSAVDGTDRSYGDINNNGLVDPNETAELNETATGLAITDVDFGYVAMMALPDLPFSGRFFQALKVTASQVGLVGIEHVELAANNVLVEVNTGPTWTTVGAVGAGPAVVDFVASFAAEGLGSDIDGDDNFNEPAGYDVGTGTLSIYIDLDGNERIGASVDNALLSIGDNDGKFVYLNGNLSFEMGPTSVVSLVTGFSSNINSTLASSVTSQFELRTLLGSNATMSSDVQTIDNVQVAALQIGGSDIQAFVGVNGPYWTDLDADDAVSWAFNTGNGDELSRTVTVGSITIDSVVYGVGEILPANTLVTLLASDGVLTFGDSTYGDINNNSIVDVGETQELNGSATGLAIANVDFGFVSMTPTIKLPLLSSQTFTAFKLTASQVALVGVKEVELSANNVLVEVNVGPTWTAVGVSGEGPAIVDFATSFPAEGTGNDVDGDGILDEPAGYQVRTGTTSAPIYIDYDGNERLGASVDNALLSIGDNDGKFVYLNGDFSFEKGPVSIVTVATGISSNLDGATAQSVKDQFALRTELGSNATLSNDLQTIDNVEVAEFQIGGSNIQAFVGVNGPYWTDLNGDGTTSWTFNTGDGDDASRTISAGAVTIDSVLFGVGDILPSNTLVTLLAADGVLSFGDAAAGTDVSYGDLDNNTLVDVDETQELN